MTTTALRRVRWPEDLEQLERLDTSFVVSVVHDVLSEPRGFSFVERRVAPPLQKRYSVDWNELATADAALVVERETQLLGVASLRYEKWNRRAVISHLYVDASARGRGIGTQLIQELRRLAIELGARSLFAETQNVNLPALRFYERSGFTLVGLDTSLYDTENAEAEIALYFAASLEA